MNEWIEITAKTVEEALTKASLELGTSSDNMEYEVVEHESKGILGMFSKDAKIKVKLKDSVENNVKSFLSRLFKCMNLDAKLDVLYDEEEELVSVNVQGDDMGVLIGKRGQTLDSLQYLTSLVLNKNSEGYIKVKIDTENYRERRKETLENLATNIAKKVKRTRKTVFLEPMNPYERRIIHSSLQNDKFVETHSEGEEPYRKVVVTLKKGVRDNRNRNYKKDYKKDYNRDNKDYKKKFRDNYKKTYQSITFDDIKDDSSNQVSEEA
jgi:spoIIIJ-associated protein